MFGDNSIPVWIKQDNMYSNAIKYKCNAIILINGSMFLLMCNVFPGRQKLERRKLEKATIDKENNWKTSLW